MREWPIQEVPGRPLSPFEHFEQIGLLGDGGVRYLARFQWLDMTTPNLVWAQDYSFDDGATWAPINWRMTPTKIVP